MQVMSRVTLPGSKQGRGIATDVHFPGLSYLDSNPFAAST
jgi:hypothetical protein